MRHAGLVAVLVIAWCSSTAARDGNAAQIATRLGRPSDLEAAWNRLTTAFPDDALTRRMALERASAAFKRKSWKSAVAYATQAAKSDDDVVRSEAWLVVGESELKQKRQKPAIKAFEAVDAVAEVEAGVRFRALAGRGLAHEELQAWDAALADYEAVAKGSSDSTLRDWARERASAVKARLHQPGSGTTPAPSRVSA